MGKKQEFKVLRAGTPWEMEAQLNQLSSSRKIGIINSNISEGTIITTVALYETHTVPMATDASIPTFDSSSSPLERHENASCDMEEWCEACQ